MSATNQLNDMEFLLFKSINTSKYSNMFTLKVVVLLKEEIGRNARVLSLFEKTFSICAGSRPSLLY